MKLEVSFSHMVFINDFISSACDDLVESVDDLGISVRIRHDRQRIGAQVALLEATRRDHLLSAEDGYA